MKIARRTALKLALAALCAGALPAVGAGMNGAVVLHGNGETSQNVADLADALRRQGLLVVTPELPWSGRRFYDRSVVDADAELDAAIAGLRAQGAARVYLIGQSLGASYALRYAARPGVTGVVVIAPNHAPESPQYARYFADDLRRARDLIAQGRPQALLEFLDFQWGNRRTRARAPANSFLSYFDPAGPMNLARSAEQVRNDVLMLWIVPNDDGASHQYALEAYKRAPSNPGSRLLEVPGNFRQATGGMALHIDRWMQETASYIRSD